MHDQSWNDPCWKPGYIFRILLTFLISSDWDDLGYHSNKMMLKVTIEMSDHPSVENGSIFYPETAVQIGDKIITNDRKRFCLQYKYLFTVYL